MTTAPTWKQYKPTNYGLTSNHLVSIYYDQQGQSFVAGGDGGMILDHDSLRTFWPGSNVPSVFPPFSNGRASYKDWDTLWFGTQYNSGIGWLVKQIGDSSHLEQFTTSDISDITKDSQGHLRVATVGDGIYVRNDTTTLQHLTTSNSGLPNNTVRTIIFKNNITYITTSGGGLAIFDGTNRIIHNGTTTWFWNQFNYNRTANVDKNWVLRTWYGNIYKFENNQRSQITFPASRLAGTQISKIESDQFGNIWVATNKWLRRYTPETNTWTKFDGTNSPFNGRTQDIAVDTLSADSMKVGIASDADGLIILSESTADYLPSAPANLAITGEDSIQIGQTYTYSLSAPVSNGVKYERTCTDPNVTIVPNGTFVQATFNPGSQVPATISCEISNQHNNSAHPALQVSTTVLDNTISIDEHEGPVEVKAYPNPTVDLIHVLGLEQEQIVSAKIYNMNWQEVAGQKIIPGEKVEVNVSNLAPGTYILMCQDKDGNGYQSRFIKQ